jgi:di/tricarboxylate transporter
VASEFKEALAPNKLAAHTTNSRTLRAKERSSAYMLKVHKNVLLFLAGIVWLLVGTMLLLFALLWLCRGPHIHDYVFAFVGIAAALLIHHLGFLKIVDKNVKRILPMDRKKSIFSFVPWKSYIIIAFMIALGALLRHSSIPKHYLAVVYISIGLALVLSSVRYFRIYFTKILRSERG